MNEVRSEEPIDRTGLIERLSRPVMLASGGPPMKVIGVYVHDVWTALCQWRVPGRRGVRSSTFPIAALMPHPEAELPDPEPEVIHPTRFERLDDEPEGT